MSGPALFRCLQLDRPALVAVYGAGGKTTLLHRLAGELAGAGERVVLTTTTRIYRPEGIPLVVESDRRKAAERIKNVLEKQNVAALGRHNLPGGKIEGIDPGWAAPLFRETGAYLLVEADGARGLPVKGFAPFEPVIPAASDLIIPLAGLDALGARLVEEEVHRPDLLARATGAACGGRFTIGDLSRWIGHAVSLGAAQAPQARVVPVLNKADLLEYPRTPVFDLAGAAAGLPGAAQIVFTSFRERSPVQFTFDLAAGGALLPVCSIVLAAGSASRMGRDKLSLPLAGKTVLEQTVAQISRADVGEIIVIVQPGSPWLKNPPAAGKYTVAANPDYREGIAASIRAGLGALRRPAQALLFALGDQPMIPADAYRMLVESYRRSPGLAACPAYNGKRGNPVLFDRRVWPQLEELTGDTGGKRLLDKLPPHEVTLVEMPYREILSDLDTPADYESLLDP